MNKRFTHYGGTNAVYSESQWDDNGRLIVESVYQGFEYWWNIRGSLGVGFEMIIAKHISLPLKFGVAAGGAGFGFTFATAIKYLW